jgi:cell division protease FtsH
MTASAQSNGSSRPRRKNDILTKRARPLARLWRFIRAVWLIPVLIYLAVAAYNDPDVLNVILLVGGFVLQVVFLLGYIVIQFVGLFWFLSRSRVETIRPEDPKAITFNDYWGQVRLVQLVKQWMTLLSDRDEFVKMGGKHINGILLYGPPGTGKTMLAKAMAGEAGIPFISTEGSSFQAMFIMMDVLKMMWFVGRAKTLAREYGACIAYIDELDAMGASRGNVMGGMGMGMGMGGFMGGAGRGALTRLLYEMDGIEEKTRLEKWKARFYRAIGKKPPERKWHVLYMASTNRPDVIDPALLRPGRFDQKIHVSAPDKVGRRAIVKGYLSRIKHDETVDIEAIVEDTPHATPAQIASALTKDAVRIALFNGRDRISQRDIDQALEEQATGIEQPIEEWDPVQRRQVAYHEAGHAVAQHYLMPDQRIVRVTIVRRGGALGYMRPVDRVEVHAQPLRRIAADIIVGMAGHVATKVHMGEYWTGAWGDNSGIRFNIWQLYSLGYFGPPVLGWENGSSNGIPQSFVPHLERFWRIMEEQTEAFLVKHADEVEAITAALLEKDTLSNDEVMALLGDNGWRSSETAFPDWRNRARLPALPAQLPAPVVASTEMPQAVLAPEAPAAAEHEDAPAPAEAPPAPAGRMLTPPRPEEFARRRLPPEPPKPAKPEAAPPAGASPAESGEAPK